MNYDKYSQKQKSLYKRGFFLIIPLKRDSQGFLSRWQDLNLRPPAPKAGALTGLRYTSIINKASKLNNIYIFIQSIIITKLKHEVNR